MGIQKVLQDYRLSIFTVGYFGEIIMVLISITLLYKKFYHLVIYFLGAIFNVVLNKAVLKPFFKQPRPSKPIPFLSSDVVDYRHPSYGMPSGHSQFVAYSIAYLLLSCGGQFSEWTVVVVVIGLITIYERWVFRNHTFNQLVTGVFVGGLVAYLVVLLRQEML